MVLALETDDHVTDRELRLVGRAARLDLLHHRALLALDLELLVLLGREIARVTDDDAERATRDLPVLQERRHQLLHHVDGDREADALRAITPDRGVHAHHFAAQIESGPPELPGLIDASVWRKL